jgi:hypothetical protein
VSLHWLTWAAIILGGWLVIGIVVGLVFGLLVKGGGNRDEQAQAVPAYRMPITWALRRLVPRKKHPADAGAKPSSETRG